MAKQIIWSKLAQDDRKSILKYWINHNKSNTYSKKLNLLFKQAVDLISKHPKIGRRTEYNDVRIKIVRDYFITYKETNQRIEILTIWDCRQDPEKFQRKISK